MKNLIAILALIALTGCGSAKFDTSHVTPAQYEKDKGACQYEASLHTSSQDSFYHTLNLYSMCMQQKGYQVANN